MQPGSEDNLAELTANGSRLLDTTPTSLAMQSETEEQLHHAIARLERSMSDLAAHWPGFELTRTLEKLRLASAQAGIQSGHPTAAFRQSVSTSGSCRIRASILSRGTWQPVG